MKKQKVLKYKNISLDLETAFCKYGKKKIIFKKGSRNFLLLKLFLENPETPISCEELFLASSENKIRRLLIQKKPGFYAGKKNEVRFIIQQLRLRFKDKNLFKCCHPASYLLGIDK